MTRETERDNKKEEERRKKEREGEREADRQTDRKNERGRGRVTKTSPDETNKPSAVQLTSRLPMTRESRFASRPYLGSYRRRHRRHRRRRRPHLSPHRRHSLTLSLSLSLSPPAHLARSGPSAPLRTQPPDSSCPGSGYGSK
jgi:hypothetical protein